MGTPTLSFLADESCDFAVVRALRAANYDVLAVSEVTTRSVDRLSSSYSLDTFGSATSLAPGIELAGQLMR